MSEKLKKDKNVQKCVACAVKSALEESASLQAYITDTNRSHVLYSGALKDGDFYNKL